ncbi:pyrimidine/purine nucleoside phosphorylase [Mucilaginibacter sp. HMF5004]|uniref:pyrimidine/purine nucleoside phosphorylase n=1 Tax=Mucilaginibacter rivuli TaxID=2857527 RepID=UPI001C604A0C|nr:pyrimidine/purine nucleoside phosphorylase [Mucilaginibacter rivuli]MBW4888612.1 pyrimidine/purine nucleoside phosphorylase [Mucilaginibacter rivuli]
MSDTISHNSYFEGKVQSLGLQTTQGKATVGVMLPGKYKFGTNTQETMVIVSGELNVNLHDAEWKIYTAQESFIVAADTSFYVSCDEDVAYICYYA